MGMFVRSATFERIHMLDLVSAALFMRRPVMASNSFPHQTDPLQIRLLIRSLDPNLVLRTVNQWLDRLESALYETDAQVRIQRLTDIEAELRKMGDNPLAGVSREVLRSRKRRSQGVGDMYFNLLMPAWREIATSERRILQANDLTCIMFALEKFAVDRGNYPSALEELTPEFLSEIPADRFTGQPLHYQPSDTGYIVYGVGDNKLDDSGADYPKDITIRMSKERSTKSETNSK
jgi:hypothetical protein